MKREEIIKFLKWYADFRLRHFPDEHFEAIADEYLSLSPQPSATAEEILDKTIKWWEHDGLTVVIKGRQCVIRAMEEYAALKPVAERHEIADQRITEEKLMPQIIEGLIAAHRLRFMKIDDSCTYDEVALVIASRLILSFARTVAERELPGEKTRGEQECGTPHNEL